MNTLNTTLLLGALFSSFVSAQKPIVLDDSYQHDKFGTLPHETVKQFRAFTASMDSLDIDNPSAIHNAMGTPEWVAYEIKQYGGECIPTKKRPKWASETQFVEQGIAPKDNSYVYSKGFRKDNPDWFVRGHLQMKLIAERMGADAAANTHTFLNAVPQRSKFNGGIWLDLEYITTAWADKFGSVWVVTGPIYLDQFAYAFVGQDDEFPVAIPDALFKIVIKENGESIDTLAFIYPQISAGYYQKHFDHSRYLTSIKEVEQLTGLSFLNSLETKQAKKIKSLRADDLWPYQKSDIIRACKKQKKSESSSKG